MKNSPASNEYRFPNSATPDGSTAYYLVRFSPPQLQERQATLFAWHRELQRLTEIDEAEVAHVKLNWWISQIAEQFESSRHPLIEAMRLHGIDQQHYLLDMLKGISIILQDTVPPGDEALLIGGRFSQLLTLPYTDEAEALAGAESVGQYDYLIRQLAADPLADPDWLEQIQLTDMQLPRGPSAAQASVARRIAHHIKRQSARNRQVAVDLAPLEILWNVWRNRHAMRQ